MNNQTLTHFTTICSFLVALPEVDMPLEGRIYAFPCDYGFDFDEEEIGREMLAPLPASLSAQVIPQANADEVDFDNLWFLS